MRNHQRFQLSIELKRRKCGIHDKSYTKTRKEDNRNVIGKNRPGRNIISIENQRGDLMPLVAASSDSSLVYRN
jgi:hypothetical protein